MAYKPLTVVGINPGTRFVGFAVIRDGDLRDWRIRGFPGHWNRSKRSTISRALTTLLDEKRPDLLAIKSHHPSRTSRALTTLDSELRAQCRSRRITIRRYSITDLNRRLYPARVSNKQTLSEMLSREFPVLRIDLEREHENRNPYHIRAFEAVGLALLGYREWERRTEAKRIQLSTT